MSERSISRRRLLVFTGGAAAVLALPTAWVGRARAAPQGIASRIVRRRNITSDYYGFLDAMHDFYRAAPHLCGTASRERLDPELRRASQAFVAAGSIFFEPRARSHDDVLLKYGGIEEILMHASRLNRVVNLDDILFPWQLQINRDCRRYRVDINRWWDQRVPVSPFPWINGQRTDWHDGAWYADGRLYRRLV